MICDKNRLRYQPTVVLYIINNNKKQRSSRIITQKLYKMNDCLKNQSEHQACPYHELLKAIVRLACVMAAVGIIGTGKIWAAPHDIYRATNIESLSNNSVLMMHQDDTGFLWLGTYDGLNRYDGKSMRVFRHEFDNPNSLSGNVINELHKAEKGYLWVLTTMGLDKFSTDELYTTEHYTEIRGGRNALFSDTLGHAFSISPDNEFSYYDPTTKQFHTCDKPAEVGTLGFCLGGITENNTLWLFPRTDYVWKIHFDFSKGYSPEQASIRQKVKMGQNSIKEVFKTVGGFYLLSENGNLIFYDEISLNTQLITNIRNEMNHYGKISSIVRYGDDIMVSFAGNGIMRLNSDEGYSPEMLFTEVGVFYMLHDSRQPLVWIATDGRGLYKMCNIDSRYKSIHSSQIPNLTKPIRTFFTDSHKNLWVGTKGDGLIILEDYPTLPPEGTIPSERITRYGVNPGKEGDLTTNQIFVIRESRFFPGRIWIAGQGPGISYINRNNGRIENLYGESIVDVHDFFEESDSVLWLASTTRGLIKVTTNGSNEVLKTEKITFKRDKFFCDEIYSLVYDGNNGLYIGCRGGIGIIHMDFETCQYNTLDAVNDRIPGMGDIISLAYSGDGTLYFGASIGGGIVDCRDAENPRLIKILTNKDGLVNDMVHSIIPTANGDIWLSTNKGITRYNTNTAILHNTSHIAGDIYEFCDNSGYISPQNGDLIFGALNGIVCVRTDTKKNHGNDDFTANIVFTGMTVNGSDRFTSPDDLVNGLTFYYDEDVINLTFAALDYIQGDYINYWYKLEGYNDKWVNLGTTPTVTLTNLPAGNYTLAVKYETDGEKNDTEEFILPIKIASPWYASGTSYFLYALTFILFISLITYRSRAIYNHKKQELERQIYAKEQERVFADRKAFFTNITHEFCSPLTIIMGICDTLNKQGETNADKTLKPYIDTLYRNSKHLNDLVQEILNVRYMDDENLVRLDIQPIALENIFKRWINVYEEIARQNDIEFTIEIDQPDLRWNTDVSCLSKIITNLMSNAFKYTPIGGKVKVSAKLTPEGCLKFEFYNTGQGISEENRQQLFNKYAVFNNLDSNSYRDISSRHGLGLFISHEMAVKLDATIDVDSVEGEYVNFIVTFPHLDVRKNHANVESDITLNTNNAHNYENKPHILVVDDNPDILWLLSNILAKEYVVTLAKNGSEARQMLERQTPSLIITDIMMPDESGIEFIKFIRKNKFTQHLPVIILTAKISEEDKIEGFNDGADAYVTKPFNSDFLKTLVARLLERKNSDKDYYRSPMSSISLESGMEISDEGKQFFENMRKYICDNFDDETKLTPDAIAKAMSVDIRTLYRRFKKHTPYTPTEFVKRIRFSYAANLIITTDLTVQEIIFRIGMSNKTSFYADFKKIYGMTPKEYRNSKH